MGKNISIVDVARHAGVSVSTVSLVMNNRPNVAPETANAVWDSVRELGYEPGGDGKKRGPKPGPRKSRQFSTMGLLMAGRPSGCFWSSSYLRALHGVQVALSERRFNLALYQFEEAADTVEALRRNPLDGIILFGAVHDEKLIHFLRRQICVQIFDTPPDDGVWDLVSVDNGAVGRLAARQLFGRGCKRLAFLGEEDAGSRACGDGFVRRVERESVRVRAIYAADLLNFSAFHAAVDRPRLRGIIEDLAAGKEGFPDGFFISNDLLAAAFYSLLYEMDYLPGTSLDIVCCNGCFPHLLGVYPAPAVIDIYAEQVGRQAVDQILWRREHRNEPHVVRLVSPRVRDPENETPETQVPESPSA